MENVKCPCCGQKIDTFFQVEFNEPFVHNNPMVGLTIYGPYSSEKQIICRDGNFIHFLFGEENRLVELGVKEAVNEFEYPELSDEEIDDHWNESDGVDCWFDDDEDNDPNDSRNL